MSAFTSSIARFVKKLFNIETATLRTNTVCQVVSYSGSTNLVKLQPCIKATRTDDPDNNTVQLPQINDIPVFQFGNGKLICTAAPQAGSYGLYVVSDRKIENWIDQGGIVPSGSRKKFDISQGFFLPGLFPTASDGDNGLIAVAVDTDRICLRTRDGASRVSVLDNGNIEIGKKGATEQALKGNEFINNKYNTHQHSTAFGPSGPPVVQVLAPDASFSTKVTLE